jgi:hypothetical protein
MKQILPAALMTAVLGLGIAPVLWAGPADDVTPVVAPPSVDNTPVSQEFSTEAGFTGGSRTKQGSATLGDVSDLNSHVSYVVSPQITDGILLRTGVNWDRNSFGLFNAAPLPNTLQAANLIIGADMTIGDRIIMRVEAHPGIYSDFVDVSGRDFDMPVQIGGTYLYSKDFQIIFGIQIDLKSNLPVVGLPGFRWQFADDWVLSAIPPKPQLQYQVNNSLTLYTGAELMGGTYQLNDQFGTDHVFSSGASATKLNGNVVDFTEIRVGAGLTWKFTPNLSLDVSGGYMPYRRFELHPDHIGYSNANTTTFNSGLSEGAPYGEVGISGSF